MDVIEQEFHSACTSCSVEQSVAPQVQAMVAHFSGRGMAKAVAKEVDEQTAREAQTRAMAPQAYRLGMMKDAVVGRCYRGGKQTMSSADLIRYFSETRAMRTRNTDFSLVRAEEVDEHGDELLPCRAAVRSEHFSTTAERLSQLPATIKQLPTRLIKTVRASTPAWFDRRAVNTEKESRRFPLSAFAALAAVAVSLMMIVASSVLVNQGEKRVNELTMEISALSGEVADLKSDLSVQNDMLNVREYAMEELGMVDERYLQMQYLSMETEDSIEVYEEEKEQNVGISALLSALGVK